MDSPQGGPLLTPWNRVRTASDCLIAERGARLTLVILAPAAHSEFNRLHICHLAVWREIVFPLLHTLPRRWVIRSRSYPESCFGTNMMCIGLPI